MSQIDLINLPKDSNVSQNESQKMEGQLSIVIEAHKKASSY